MELVSQLGFPTKMFYAHLIPLIPLVPPVPPVPLVPPVPSAHPAYFIALSLILYFFACLLDDHLPEPQISDIRMMMSLMSAIRFHAAGNISSHVLFSLQYSTWQINLGRF
jgi:hypothetical protein